MEVRHRDWSGDDKSDNPSNETARAISPREPLKLGGQSNGRGDAQDPTCGRADDESGLPCGVPKDRAGHRTETSQDPRG